MAYVVVSFKGKEVGRWPLTPGQPLTVGRAAECDVVVRDILLSRQHCELMPYRNGWIARDLGSKNGTRIDREPITRRGLADGDVLSLGNTTIRFRIGGLPTAHQPPRRRPADPFEALAGTVAGVAATDDLTAAAVPLSPDAAARAESFPHPRPAPPDPAAYSTDDLYGMLSEIASSSWDSIYAHASRPRRAIPRVPAALARPPAKGVGGTVALPPAATKEPADLSEPAEPVRLPRRSDAGFAETLQVGAAAVAPVPSRPARPALPFMPAEDRAGTGSERPRPGLWSAVRRPLAAIQRWIGPMRRAGMY